MQENPKILSANAPTEYMLSSYNITILAYIRQWSFRLKAHLASISADSVHNVALMYSQDI